jgi:hypothetical protein
MLHNDRRLRAQTSRPSTCPRAGYTITCVGRRGRGCGCTYVYTTDNGTISIRLTKAEQTATNLSCSPTTLNGGRRTCTVTVANLWNSSNVPVGKLHVTNPYGGKLSNNGTCTLTSGSCKFTWTPAANACGAYVITATYLGTAACYTSTASVTITVNTGC